MLAAVLALSLIGSRATSKEAPFELRVADAKGNARSNVRVIAEDRIICYTDQHGRVRWNEQELMNKTVSFRVADYPNSEAALRVVRGGHADLIVR
jgi:hypothetical protein